MICLFLKKQELIRVEPYLKDVQYLIISIHYIIYATNRKKIEIAVKNNI